MRQKVADKEKLWSEKEEASKAQIASIRDDLATFNGEDIPELLPFSKIFNFL